MVSPAWYALTMRAPSGSRAIVISSILGAWFISGCAARQTSDPFLVAALYEARQHNEAEQKRVAALEARLAELEREAAVRAERDRNSVRNTSDQRLVQKLDQLLATNQRLLREARAARERAEATQRQADDQEKPAPTDLPAAQSQEQRLREIVYEMHGEPGRWRGGLSLEQSKALRVLLKSERSLDSDNPWH
jgi:flagellar biosynthesis GTPase FlhF